MSQNTELTVRYAQLVEAKLRATSVFANLFNNRYEGQPKAGAVKVPVRSDATAVNYSIANGASNGDGTYGLTVPSTSYATIVLDKDYAINELVDGYNAAAVPDGLIADRLDSAGYALGHKIDSMLVAMLEDSDNYTAVSTSETTIYKQIIDAIAQARAAKVEKEDMWVAVAPSAYAGLLKGAEFISMAHLADAEKGLIGKIAGVPVYETNNLTVSSTQGQTTSFIVGNKAFCHFVDEFAVEPAVRDLADGVHIGAAAVQGRKICGALISKPATVFVKKV